MVIHLSGGLQDIGTINYDTTVFQDTGAIYLPKDRANKRSILLQFVLREDTMFVYVCSKEPESIRPRRIVFVSNRVVVVHIKVLMSLEWPSREFGCSASV
jgi:hypothetical protein